MLVERLELVGVRRNVDGGPSVMVSLEQVCPALSYLDMGMNGFGLNTTGDVGLVLLVVGSDMVQPH